MLDRKDIPEQKPFGNSSERLRNRRVLYRVLSFKRGSRNLQKFSTSFLVVAIKVYKLIVALKLLVVRKTIKPVFSSGSRRLKVVGD